MRFPPPRRVITSRVRLERGFSLLEIVVVMALIAILVGGAMGIVAISADKRQLTAASGKVGSFAKRARSVAMVQQRPYALVFTEQGVQLMPFAEATGLGEGANSGKAANEALSSVRDTYRFDDNYRLSIRRWGSNDWLPITERATQIWRFDPNGLCEPIGVRIALNQSWMEETYHPLSAAVDETSSYFP